MPIQPPLSRLALVAALVLPTLLAACEGMQNPLGPNPDNELPEDGDFVRSKPLTAPEFDFLWERSKFMLQTDGYGIDGSRTNREDREIVSQWKTMLAPSRYQGKRRRVVLRFEEGDEGTWFAEAAVTVQRNEDIQDPMQIARAVWKSEGPDLPRAEVLIYKLETGFPTTEGE